MPIARGTAMFSTIDTDSLSTVQGGKGVNAYTGRGDLEAPVLKNCRYVGKGSALHFRCEPGRRRVREGDSLNFYRGDDES